MSPATLSRAGVARATLATNAAAMGTTYNTCRNNYFTCMDQFCANRDDQYRRCVCSSRLSDVREMQRVLNQTQTQLKDFQDYNIDSVDKTAGEVKAMLTATAGEYAAYKSRDNSDSTNTLQSISSILAGTRSNALSTAGTLDIAGDINQIWGTTDFISGADISTLEGDKLYNAVHNQCYEMVAESCGSISTLNMVVSAYGMVVEQDCNTIMTNLNNKKTAAQTAIRQTERELNVARLDNYNVHNSAEINECIAQVRKDITADTACGANYIHCADVTGKFLNYVTGEPIYTPDFYRLEKQLTVDGDILTQPLNQLLVSVLNKKRDYAKRGLDTCRDIADPVWEEFLRQAITEIYQVQQQKVRTVKDECISVVTDCYDTQRGQLKDFSIQDKQALLGQAVELTEELCRVKLETCSNLYAGGPGGMEELLKFVSNVQTAVIADDCERYLEKSITEYCSFALDSNHPYPYSCRVKPSGSWDCLTNPGSSNKCDSDPKSKDDALYYTISTLAKENCTRPSQQDKTVTTTTLPPDVQKSVNSVFDRLYNNMWGLLGGICRSMDGEWVNELQVGDICVTNDPEKDPCPTTMEAEHSEYKKTVFSHSSWGQCERSYCYASGDMYVLRGKKYCCMEGYTYDTTKRKCVMTDTYCQINVPGSRWEPKCTKGTGEVPTENGCATESCRCESGLVSYMGQCRLFTCEMGGAEKDSTCAGAGTGEGGCLSMGCRCPTGMMPSYVSETEDGNISTQQGIIKMCIEASSCPDGAQKDEDCIEGEFGPTCVTEGCSCMDGYTVDLGNETCVGGTKSTDCPENAFFHKNCSSANLTGRCVSDGCACREGFTPTGGQCI